MAQALAAPHPESHPRRPVHNKHDNLTRLLYQLSLNDGPGAVTNERTTQSKMDAAYDHVQEEIFQGDNKAGQTRNDKDGSQQSEQSASNNEGGGGGGGGGGMVQGQSINQEFADAYKAFSASPWGVKLGGFWASAKKQGEQYYATASQEVGSASGVVADLANRARSVTVGSPPTSPRPDQTSHDEKVDRGKEEGGEDGVGEEKDKQAHPDRPESLPADIYKEASSTATSALSRLREQAARRLKEAQKLEDAADEALLQWGTSLGAFLKDAVSIAPPSAEDVESGKGEVLFASKDPESGKRVVHATRLDAQLHVIHCSMDSFLKDPKSAEWEGWREGFDVEKRTEEVKRDLERYEQLRRAMEKLVPEQVAYGLFWARYYFLRHVVETEEARRRELLKGDIHLVLDYCLGESDTNCFVGATTNAEEEVGWDDESDDEQASAAATPKNGQAHTSTSTSTSTSAPSATSKADASKASSTPPSAQPVAAAKDDSDNATLKPVAEPRKSNEHSSAGSDASYDLVSGATSRTPGSPSTEAAKKVEDSDDEDDWE